MKEVVLDASVENIGVVTDFIDAELEARDCSMRALTQINIAIDELFGNIAHYAYAPGSGKATVRIEFEEDPLSAVITLTDGGKPFNPLESREPDVTASAEDRAIGGLGIFMVKKTMDAMEYQYRDEKNILKIKKKLQ